MVFVCFVLSLLLLLIMLLLGLLVVVVFLRVLRCNFLDIVGILFEDDPCGMSGGVDEMYTKVLSPLE